LHLLQGKRFGRIVLAAGIGAALLAAGHAARAQAAAAPLQPVIMAMPSEGLAYSLAYIADAKGLWAKHGLDMHEVSIGGIGATNAVIAGSADFAHASGATLARAAARGQRLLAIVSVLDRASVEIALRKPVADAAHFDPKASLAERAQVLRGRTISIDAINSIDQAYLQIVAKRGGVDPDSIRLAVLKADNALAALASDQIDGMAMSPPWPQAAMLDRGAVLVASGLDGDPPDYLPLATTLVLTKPETCATRRALCEGIGQAMKDAAQILRGDPDAAVAVLAKRLPTVDPKLIAAVLAKVRKATPDPLAVTQKGLENAERVNIEAGLMKPEEKLTSYDGLFTGEFVK
jgi:sulfonate transport system substrate-binding protein